MSTRKKQRKSVPSLPRRIWRVFDTFTRALVNGVLRSLMVFNRRSRSSQAGFVLPTVIMVLLVVVLLTTAILIRSFDRAKNASNYRVNEAVLNAATPALDRARAKIQYLFSPAENNLPGNTPAEPDIDLVLKGAKYTLGDEVPLKLANGAEVLETAWKFPVDTDNDGQFDSFTLYGIYFRNPPVDTNNNPTRPRTPLEARALPQDDTGQGDPCSGAAVSGSTAGWYEVGGKLKKAFFTYVATVPITQEQFTTLQTTGYKNIPAAAVPQQFEIYKGNRGFSALEMQLDQARNALDNNAVWYEDDLMINGTNTIRLNGRVHTNSNLMTSNPDGVEINFLQVSSPYSCYYEPENAKIVVGGNVVPGGPGAQNSSGTPLPDTNFGNSVVRVDLYQGQNVPPRQTGNIFINNGNMTTRETPLAVASNSTAFAKRLNLLVEGALSAYYSVNQTEIGKPTPGGVSSFTRFPQEIRTSFATKYDDASNAEDSLRQAIETYFKERIRRVSYAEVPITDPPDSAIYRPGSTTPMSSQEGDANFIFAGGGDIAAPLDWMEFPAQGTRYVELNNNELDETGSETEENEIGDRILVGNGLPKRWVTNTATPYQYANEGQEQPIPGGRKREGRVQTLDDLGNTSRGGFWEQAAAKLPGTKLAREELAGGLRIITGAGIYIDGRSTATGGTGRRVTSADLDPANITGGTFSDATLYNEIASFLPEPPKPSELETAYGITVPAIPTNAGLNAPAESSTKDQYFKVVWPDTMPMYRFMPKDPWDRNQNGTPEIAEGLKGDLQMRATVVYHHTRGDQPIACISSYYDPTDQDTAVNFQRWTNNGINYPPPTDRSITTALRQQARMIFPDGRWVNEPLKRAIERRDAGIAENDLRLDEKAAIDAAKCALNIVANPASTGGLGIIPDGAIKEQAFLDARQIKTLHRTPNKTVVGSVTTYNPDPGTLLADINDPEKLKIAQLSDLQAPNSLAEYALPIEERQPLEIRVTEINLAKTADGIGGTGGSKRMGGTATGDADDTEEFLFPNSGIIYASRDDALPDITDPTGSSPSATDFKLDPTRRPSGIRIINGQDLSRKDFFRTAEKGLILASDLPVYVKGDFNMHYRAGSTTRVEEFTEQLSSTPFYDRGDTSPTRGRDENFACRPGSPGCGTIGDQWRAARILSDAVTLLSNNFRDGFREEGDYDINNNAGNFVVKARLKNGFWSNSYATSAVPDPTAVTNPSWYATAGAFPGFPKDFDAAPGNQGSSYVMNNVTPIQRRVSFRQYLMEGCTKKLVSECSPQDWVFAKDPLAAGNLFLPASFVGSVIPGGNLTALPTVAGNNLLGNNAGTTSQLPTGIFSAAPRRVAFRRNEFGALEVQNTCTVDATTGVQTNCHAIPIGVESTQVKDAPYNASLASTNPTEAANALWYATTTDNTNPSGTSTTTATINPGADISYNTPANNLYYLPYEPEVPPAGVQAHERQLLLPGTPEFPVALGVPSLNGIDAARVDALHPAPHSATNGSDYAVCTYSQSSQGYKPAGPLATQCPTDTITAINQTVLKLLALNTPTPGLLSIQTTFPADRVLRATAKVNVYYVDASAVGIPAGWVPGGPLVIGSTDPIAPITFDRGDQVDPVFILRSPPNGAISFVANFPVELKLNGVDPNNIFWVSELGVFFDPATPHKVAGNFLGVVNDAGPATASDPNAPDRFTFKFTGSGSTPAARINGRILGFKSINTAGNPEVPADVMTAMTTTDQPLLLPVLNVHSPSPTGTPASSPFAFEPKADRWLPPAEATTFNGVFVMGDSPSRPLPGVNRNPAEFGGGLQNFPRFLEAWQEGANANTRAATISGGLIQFKKSVFASAPFETIDNPGRDNSLFFDNPPLYTAEVGNTALRDFRYRTGSSASKAPYYLAPERAWGYDVGLLSQTADLFARRFVAPSAGDANEFYREVSRDDRWVRTLLCATEKQGTTDVPALPATERPSGC